MALLRRLLALSCDRHMRNATAVSALAYAVVVLLALSCLDQHPSEHCEKNLILDQNFTREGCYEPELTLFCRTQRL